MSRKICTSDNPMPVSAQRDEWCHPNAICVDKVRDKYIFSCSCCSQWIKVGSRDDPAVKNKK